MCWVHFQKAFSKMLCSANKYISHLAFLLSFYRVILLNSISQLFSFPGSSYPNVFWNFIISISDLYFWNTLCILYIQVYSKTGAEIAH